MTTTKTDPALGRKVAITTANGVFLMLLVVSGVLVTAQAYNAQVVDGATAGKQRLNEQVSIGMMATTFLSDLDEDLAEATAMVTTTPTSLTIPLRGNRVVQYEVIDGLGAGPSLVVRFGVKTADGIVRFSTSQRTSVTHLEQPEAVFSAPLPISTRLRVDVGRGVTEHDVEAGLLFAPSR